MENTVRSTPTPTAGISQDAVGTLNRASSSAHAAVDSIAEAADQAARKAKPAIDRVAALAHQAVNSAANVAAPTADWVAEQGATLKATQKKLVANTCNYVTTNPLKAVGIAVVAGFVLSRVLLLFRDGKRGATPPSA